MSQFETWAGQRRGHESEQPDGSPIEINSTMIQRITMAKIGEDRKIESTITSARLVS
jgi:hypothetical protein